VSYSAGFLGGRPFPRTLRMASRAESSYMAVGPTYTLGLMPATRSLRTEALYIATVKDDGMSLEFVPYAERTAGL
jgi:hypothetical protein